MKRAIIVAVVALLIGLGVVFLGLRLTCYLEAMQNRHALQADELKKLRDELAAERGRRQRLEEVIRQRRR
jgi:uncharacterized membrane-anchored protein YhcB (DUF1043 family)